MPTWNGYDFDDETWRSSRRGGISGMAEALIGADENDLGEMLLRMGVGFRQGRERSLVDSLRAQETERRRLLEDEERARVQAERDRVAQERQAEIDAANNMRGFLEPQIAGLSPEEAAQLPPPEAFSSPQDYNDAVSGFLASRRQRQTVDAEDAEMDALFSELGLRRTGVKEVDRKLLESALLPEKPDTAAARLAFDREKEGYDRTRDEINDKRWLFGQELEDAETQFEAGPETQAFAPGLEVTIPPVPVSRRGIAGDVGLAPPVPAAPRAAPPPAPTPKLGLGVELDAQTLRGPWGGLGTPKKRVTARGPAQRVDVPTNGREPVATEVPNERALSPEQLTGVLGEVGVPPDGARLLSIDQGMSTLIRQEWAKATTDAERQAVKARLRAHLIAKGWIPQ